MNKANTRVFHPASSCLPYQKRTLTYTVRKSWEVHNDDSCHGNGGTCHWQMRQWCYNTDMKWASRTFARSARTFCKCLKCSICSPVGIRCGNMYIWQRGKNHGIPKVKVNQYISQFIEMIFFKYKCVLYKAVDPETILQRDADWNTCCRQTAVYYWVRVPLPPSCISLDTYWDAANQFGSKFMQSNMRSQFFKCFVNLPKQLRA